ncbi:MAG: hypothetical protein ACFFBV_01555 [Promethearchaeota archaeon]
MLSYVAKAVITRFAQELFMVFMYLNQLFGATYAFSEFIYRRGAEVWHDLHAHVSGTAPRYFHV